MTGIDLDERFMRAAIEEAKHACEQGEVPIGAVVVRDGEIIARASNRREVDQDPSAHAEFTALCEAAQVLGRWRLSDCAVYVTLEPCCMCAGLMVNARVGRCVYGAADAKAGALGSVFNLAQTSKLNHRFDVRAGVLADDCAALLSDFFSSKRSGFVDMHLAGHASHQNARVQAAEFAVLPVVDAASAHAAPRVLMAIDSFKGSANSEEIEAWVAEGMRRVDPCVDIRSVALADGGEGTVDAFSRICAGERKTVRVTGAFGTPINAEWLLAHGDKPDDTWAVIEMATAAGIGQSARTDAAALAASTYGVGELLRTAVAAGAHTVYIGLGGSATNDGGAGFLQALGARLLDADGKSIDAGLAGLARLASIDLRPAFETIGDTHLVILSDVTNPLVGDHGALAVFGPQKGLDTSDSAMVDKREGWMISYGHLLDKARAEIGTTVTSPETEPAVVTHSRKRFSSVLGVPGAGAAGGLGAALLALGAEIHSGVDVLLDIAQFDDSAHACDLVITGEGNMDAQTAHGKAPAGVAARAKAAGKPVIAIVGGRASDLDDVYRAGIDLVLPLCRVPMSLEQALDSVQVHENAVCAGEAALRAYLLRSK